MVDATAREGAGKSSALRFQGLWAQGVSSVNRT